MAVEVATARDRALTHLVLLQSPRGDWEGEMVWCPMITAQVVIARHVVGRPVDASTRAGILRYLRTTATTEGVWGLHPESPGFVFVTTLVYVALRLLGLPVDDPRTAGARKWLQAQPGGVAAVPAWGKFWLALLGLYGWGGVTPVLPELYALPARLPFHPARWYCHTRYIYLAMAYLYGRRATANLGPLGEALRGELYAVPYATLDFEAHRHDVTPGDLHARPGRGLRLAAAVLAEVDRAMPDPLRRRALASCLARIRYEQHESRERGLSPVNAVLNCLALWANDPDDPGLDAGLAGLEAWRWEGADGGVRYAGARSNAWDTAFALRALFTPEDARHAPAIRRGAAFLRATQLDEELPRWWDQHREPIAGGWCFSDGAHRWPVSDCTAEVISALLETEHLLPTTERLSKTRRERAAAFILARQNRDGGFGTYEPRRGGRWLERLNASEMFGDCMTERSYVECTASCVGALARLRARDASLDPRLTRAIDAGVRFLRASQGPDGGVPAAWGVHFTYGAFHFTAGLRAAGVGQGDPALVRVAEFLLARQGGDGGWGEHWSSCASGRWVDTESAPVQTAWALLALLEVVGAGHPAVERGIAWLVARQVPGGGWPSGPVNGVFFGTAMLEYRLYPAYFPAWALARYTASA
jgi:squalene/oxidosqualene cyclase-like protein